MRTMIHQYELDSDLHVGGIDTWISDYLQFCRDKIRLIGVAKSVGQVQGKNDLYSIMKTKETNKLPISLLFAWRLILNRKLISNEIYVHRIDYVPILRLIKPRAEIKLFIHTDSLQQTKAESDSYWKMAPSVYFLFERMALSMCSRVFVYAETDFPRIKTLFHSAMQLRSWYNDSIFKNTKIERDLNHVLWIGRFENPKDPLLAVRAFAEASVVNPGLRLTLIGQGSLRDDVENEVIRLGLSERVLISGPKKQNELALEMNRAGVLLHTSNFEGSPRILIEALACGMILVSNSFADPDELSIKFGCCSQSRDAAEIAKSLLNATKVDLNLVCVEDYLDSVAGSKVVLKDFI